MATTVASTPGLRARHSPPDLPPKLLKLSFTHAARPRALPDFNKPASPPPTGDVGALDPFLRSPVLLAADAHDVGSASTATLTPGRRRLAAVAHDGRGVRPQHKRERDTTAASVAAPTLLQTNAAEPLMPAGVAQLIADTTTSAPSTPGPSPPLTPPPTTPLLGASHLDDWVAVTPYVAAADDVDDGWFGVEVSVSSLSVSLCDGVLKMVLVPDAEVVEAGGTEAPMQDA
ncbi:uncharacterized protein LOC62_01G000543 [Vanrija pseudolonga]|uniref:Uncharacterized protein n=1 Tax=Vanrija pseudolonga TaxID=143232 RepID=A0AAF0Y2W2_9TREE|nr:hypothetical protein LOC62_01G000543 [Vanrija pseudolonga]